jgi:hypothetical protein
MCKLLPQGPVSLGVLFEDIVSRNWYWNDILPVFAVHKDLHCTSIPVLFVFLIWATNRYSAVLIDSCSHSISGRVKWYGAVHKLERCWIKESGGNPT